ncbi:UPF0180 protein YkuS [Marinithermofilum abyssi]|uniref:UPF0180 protein YkuS n=1 Tax=Marinithermofilum abyssi TaxID=1571185 RepID=A0A8J2YAX6_9BACL|nr:YkuS family protein [Marinithermofilum abyssi]GGE23053.1 UPF0180 protein YkuS [Marinithermofilum abyssi]
MAKQRVAVEEGLQAVSQALQNRGYEVVSLDGMQQGNCACFVVSGGDNNMMGMQDTVTEAAVVNAEGMTAEEVCDAVERTINVQ